MNIKHNNQVRHRSLIEQTVKSVLHPMFASASLNFLREWNGKLYRHHIKIEQSCSPKKNKQLLTDLFLQIHNNHLFKNYYYNQVIENKNLEKHLFLTSSDKRCSRCFKKSIKYYCNGLTISAYNSMEVWGNFLCKHCWKIKTQIEQLKA